MKKCKILHMAPFNVAGVPVTLVKAERKLGYQSRLITFGKHPHGYEEDICLNLPLINFKGLSFVKRLFSDKTKLKVTNTADSKRDNLPPVWRPNGIIEKLLIQFREFIWTTKISQIIEAYHLYDFDIIQLDGGLSFYRDARIIKTFKSQGKKIICLYTGSDLRTRGVIPAIDKLADLNVTVEFDHLKLHPNINHVLFPFNWQNFEKQNKPPGETILIGHAPTNREAKGSDTIISTVNELIKKYPVKLILIENVPYSKALEMKSGCDIFIDQIGDLGYGINSLESLAMGIPTCSCLAPGFQEKYPSHPFIVIDKDNLKFKLIELIESENLRSEKSTQSREWVSKHHDAQSIVKQIHQLAGIQ